MNWTKRSGARARGAVAILGALLVLACGQAKLGGGISGTSMVVGSISAFGSVVVGGIAFDTSTARVTIEGNLATADDLRLGMVVSVLGVVGDGGRTGTAEVVAAEKLLEAPIDTIDVARRTIVALGQEIVSDEATIFDPRPLEDLRPADPVKVSGFFDAEGRLRATRVEWLSRDDRLEFEIRGEIAEFDAGARLFRVGTVSVDFTSATIENAPPGGLAAGLLVEVEAAGWSGEGPLVAVEVEVLDPNLLVGEGDGVGLEGFVTAVLDGDEFVVSGLNGTQRVRIQPSTLFENGAREDVVVNARLEIEGRLGADGLLEATEIEFTGGPGDGST